MIADWLVVLLTRVRGLRALLLGRGDRTGLTVACTGCPDESPHDAHLAWGAIRYLGRERGRMKAAGHAG